VSSSCPEEQEYGDHQVGDQCRELKEDASRFSGRPCWRGDQAQGIEYERVIVRDYAMGRLIKRMDPERRGFPRPLGIDEEVIGEAFPGQEGDPDEKSRQEQPAQAANGGLGAGVHEALNISSRGAEPVALLSLLRR